MAQAPVTYFSTNFDVCRPFSNTSVNILLAASTAISWTVPGTSNQMYRANFSISSTADAYVRNNATAVVPVSNTITSTSNQQRISDQMALFVRGGDVLSFISTGTPQIGVSLLLVQNV
jgi:hypothetical protein